MDYAGGCQCGRIRYRAAAPSSLSSICYCRMCQKASGAPFMVLVRFPADKVSWSVPPEVFASSNLVERGFCKSCGTPLTYRRVDGPNISLTLNSFDDPTALPPPEAGYATEQRAAWLSHSDRLPSNEEDLTAAPAFQNNQVA